MSNNPVVVQSQITSIQGLITDRNSCIAAIDASSPVGAAVIASCAAKRARLVAEVAAYTTQLANYQSRLTMLQGGWSGTQATLVNQINATFTGSSSYSDQITSLMSQSQANQQQFFQAYAQANTVFLQQLVITNYFNMP